MKLKIVKLYLSKLLQIKDVAKLLSAYFGENWAAMPNLQYYEVVVEDPQQNAIDNSDSDFDEINEEDPSSIV